MFVQYLAEHNNKGRPIAASVSVSLDNINHGWIRGGVCLTAKEVKSMTEEESSWILAERLAHLEYELVTLAYTNQSVAQTNNSQL